MLVCTVGHPAALGSQGGAGPCSRWLLCGHVLQQMCSSGQSSHAQDLGECPGVLSTAITGAWASAPQEESTVAR